MRYNFTQCSPVSMRSQTFNCCPRENCVLDTTTGIVEGGECLEGTEGFMCSVCTRNQTHKYYRLGAACFDCSYYSISGILLLVSYCAIFLLLLFVNYKSIFFVFFLYIIHSIVFDSISGENNMILYLSQFGKKNIFLKHFPNLNVFFFEKQSNNYDCLSYDAIFCKQIWR